MIFIVRFDKIHSMEACVVYFLILADQEIYKRLLYSVCQTAHV